MMMACREHNHAESSHARMLPGSKYLGTHDSHQSLPEDSCWDPPTAVPMVPMSRARRSDLTLELEPPSLHAIPSQLGSLQHHARDEPLLPGCTRARHEALQVGCTRARPVHEQAEPSVQIPED